MLYHGYSNSHNYSYLPYVIIVTGIIIAIVIVIVQNYSVFRPETKTLGSKNNPKYNEYFSKT